MKNTFYFFVGLLISCALLIPYKAHAALVMTPAITGYSASAGRYAAAAGSFTMTAANDGYIAQSVINVAGKAVTMPATLRMAANAGQIALAGMKLNPWGIAATLALPWLLDKGLQYVNGQWMKASSPVNNGAGAISTSCSAIGDPNPCAYQDFTAYIAANGYTPAANTCYNTVLAGIHGQGPTNGNCVWDFPDAATRDAATAPTQKPATDSDWIGLPDPLPAIAPELPYAPYLPDGAPVNKPEFAPADVPLGNPYTKPDGSTAQARAKISPSGDGQVTVSTYDQPVTDASGQPVANPQPQTTPDPQTDPCDSHPDRAGCASLGTPPSPDAMPTSTKQITFSPVSIASNPTCPAPYTVTAFGRTISIEYTSVCTYASGMRPVVLAVGYITALFIIFGVPRTQST